jgi:formylglycine-generating enzyme required for sulfatase activity
LIASLSDKELAKGITPDSPLWALALSFEHERIHIETSSVLINELPLKYLKFPNGLLPPYYPSPSTPTYEPKSGIDYPKNNWLEIEAQTITLGKQPDEHTFGWDNEYGSRTYSVPAFRANQFKISNGEYLEFVKDGGYSKAELWTEAGWKWR